ncbi:YraN family protein [Desulfotruncus alcoholivorax]|uniref:YraN family protein n=1 Tax=Desulfotruncus alcoholivorax TaxID=265477 RepID=UPI0003F82FA6|nr:YraN family protein [Desulfotruncus alcoholivorax]
MSQQRRSLGIQGEDLAAQYLQKKGLVILERNFRCRLGEIDIIARHGDCIVFIEVKTRSSDKFGLAQESVTRQKIYKLRRLAQAYLAQRSFSGLNVRFDVVAVNSARETKVTHIENAF